MNQRCLVPDELRAHSVLLREQLLAVLLKILVEVEINTIPKLGFPSVQVVDRVEIHIFFVPAEHGLPRAHIQVG